MANVSLSPNICMMFIAQLKEFLAVWVFVILPLRPYSKAK
jgi:hypothetical protein